MSKRNMFLRGIALLLASVMILTSVPTNVLATESDEIIENETEIEIENESETDSEYDLKIESETESETESKIEPVSEDKEVFDYHSDELATVFEGQLTSDEIAQKSGLYSGIASVKAAKADVDYVSDEVIMWSDSREKAELAAKAFSKATGFLVYVDSYDAEIAVLKIETRYASKLKENGVSINSLVDEDKLSFDNPALTLMSIAADSNNNLPPVYQNGIVAPYSVGNAVVVDVNNEVKDSAHFNDPMLGKNGTDDKTVKQITDSKYQWYHELVNDKFVWNEMDKLKDLGDNYDGLLNKDFIDNLNNTTVAVIDSGLNDGHKEWAGSADSVSTDSKSFVSYSFYREPGDYESEKDYIGCPADKPNSIICPILEGNPVNVIYPQSNPWKSETCPPIPEQFTEDYPDDTGDFWHDLWHVDDDSWHSAWDYMWNENYYSAYQELWNTGSEESKEGWQLAWEILINKDFCDNQGNYGWHTAYSYLNTKEFDDINSYHDEYTNYGGGHGSNVTGIIAEPADNNEAGRGVAAGVKVMALKVFGPEEVDFDDPEEVTLYNNGFYAQLYNKNKSNPGLITDADITAFKNHKAKMKNTAGRDASIIRAINYARYHSHMYQDENGNRYNYPDTEIPAPDENVRVINMSLGGPVPNYLFEEAINLATDSNILVVVSAGNDDSYHRSAPADYDNSLNVASLNADYGVSSFSNHGTGIDIAAPGGEMHSDENYPVEYTDSEGQKQYFYFYEQYNISTSAPNLANGQEYDNPNKDTYSYQHGTSQASPVVTGVAALAVAQYPDIDAYMLRDLLISTAMPIKTKYATVNKCVDAAAAVGISTDLSDTYLDTYSVYDSSDMDNSITVDPSFMTLGSTIAMTYPSNNHAVFYFTANGKNPVIDDEVPDIDNDSAEPSKSGTYKSYNGIVTVKKLIDKGLISGKGSFTFKYNVLLYGVQSKTYEVKMTFDTPVTSSIAIRPKDNRPGLSYSFDDGTEMDGMKLGVGNKLQLAVDFTPASAQTKQIFWESNDTSLVTVSQSGLVTAKFLPGKTYNDTTGATITAKVLDGSMDDEGNEITASYYVQVVPQIKEIKFTEMGTISLEYDENSDSYATFQLWPYDTNGTNEKNLYVYPDNASISMFYSSDNNKIVTVDSDGLIQYVSDGHTYITVTSADNPKVKTKIEVFADKDGNKDKTIINDIPDISAGQSVQLTYTKSYNKQNTKYEWYVAETEAGVNYYLNGEYKDSVTETPNPSDYFTLNAKTGKLTAKKNLPWAACFTIGLKEAGTNNREPKILKKIKIYPATTEIKLNNSEISVECAFYAYCTLDIADLIDVLEPAYNEETLTRNIVTLKSSNPGIISSVKDANILMMVHKPGKATVTITADDGSKKSAKINITVLPAYAKSGALYEVNDCYALTPSNKLDYKFVANSDTNNYPSNDVSYTVSSSVGDPNAEACVTVDSKGIVKPVVDKLKKFVPDLERSGGSEMAAREMTITINRPIWEYVNGRYVEEVYSFDSQFYLYSTPTKEIVPWEDDPAVKVTDIQLNSIGETQKLFVKSLPEGACQIRYDFSSANKNVCSVLMDGTIVANGTGSTYVTITAKDGSKAKAKVKVTVTQPVTGINIVSPTGEFVVGAGKSLKLKAEVNANASNKKVTWGLYSAIKPDPENAGENVVDFDSVITDKNIATMSNGTIKAGKIAEPMTVYAVAQSTDGSNLYGFVPVDLYPVTASIKIFNLPVGDANKKEVKDITLSKFIIDGSELKARADLYPFAYPAIDVNAPTYNGNFAVKSSNTKVAVATVLFDPVTHRMQIVVTPVNKGKCKINVTALDGSNKTAAVNVTVINPVTGISLSTKSGIRSVAAGKSLQIIASTNPDASNKKVNWEIVKLTDIETGVPEDEPTDPPTPVDIPNEDISKYVSITSGGVVKAVKDNNVEMTATVRATAADGSGYSREMVIYLNKKVSRLFVYTKDSNEKEMNLLIGSKTQFLTTVNTDACNTKINWCLNKTNVEDPNAFDPAANGITVSAKGLLTIPKKEELLGKEFYVTAWAADKNKRAAQHDVLIRIGDGSYITCNRGGTNEDVNEVVISYNMTSVLNFVVRNAKGEIIDKTISADNISVIDEGKVLDKAATVRNNNSITITTKETSESEGILDPAKPVKITVCADPVKGPFKTVIIRVYGDGGLYQKINALGQHDKIIDVGYPTLPGYSNANSDVLRFCVWVETDYDTDGDGKKDLVKAFLQVPRFAVEKAKGDLSLVPTIYDPTPYDAGTVSADVVSIRQPYTEDIYAAGEARSRDVDTISVLECASEAKQDSWYYRFPNLGQVMADAEYGYSYTSYYNYFLERGYAICLCSGIGTYDSEGFELCGTTLERDSHKAVVEWLHGKEGRVAFTDKKGTKMVKADWSNGNIAMTGVSYGGTLPYEVAVTGVEGLKTIIPIGGIADWYEYTNSQGVALRYDAFYTPYLANYNCGRFMDNFDGDMAMTQRYENWLGDTQIKQVEANGDYKDDVWSSLNYSEYSDATKDNYHDGKLDINCSALIVSGLNDNNVLTKHSDKMYRAFTNAGKEAVMILHQGGHCNLFNMYVIGKRYEDIVDSWLSRYLYDDTVENYDKAVDFLDSCFGELSSDGGRRSYKYPVCAQKNNVEDKGKAESWIKMEGWENYSYGNKEFESSDIIDITQCSKGPGSTQYKTITVDNDYAEAMNEWYLSSDVGYEHIAEKLLEMARTPENNNAVLFNDLKVNLGPMDYTIAGIPAVRVKLEIDTDNMSLSSLIEDENHNPADGMMVTAYLVDEIVPDEEHPEWPTSFGAYIPNVKENGSSVKTGGYFGFDVFKRTNTKAKIISYGWTDLNNPGGGYYSNDDAYKNRQTWENNASVYTIYMNPTCYTMEVGHQLQLVLIAWDPKTTYLDASYRLVEKDNNKYLLKNGGAEYSFKAYSTDTFIPTLK